MQPHLITKRTKDITDQRFGRLLVVAYAGKNIRRLSMWQCECDCGNNTIVNRTALISGATMSCGCLHRDIITKHGLSGSPEYESWRSMKGRCQNPNNQAFSNYGKRGITVCKRWNSFENFLADMGQRPTHKHSIDRIDNSLGYFPGNCRWATKRQQSNNARSNHLVTYCNETHTIAEWSRITDIPRKTLYERFRRKWSAERALTEPVAKYNYRD